MKISIVKSTKCYDKIEFYKTLSYFILRVLMIAIKDAKLNPNSIFDYAVLIKKHTIRT